MNPDKVYASLSNVVVGQESAKKTLSVAMYAHHLRATNVLKGKNRLEKSNILLVGPSGCGKTYLAQQLAKSCGFPSTIFDCSELTGVGYVGSNADDIIMNLVAESGNNLSKAKYGIVVLDEIDKLQRKSGENNDPAGVVAQQSLLKLIEGKQVFLPDLKRYIDTSNMLFIGAGAFVDMKVESQKGTVGVADLIKYGLIPELVGRLPRVVRLTELTQEQLEQVVRSSLVKKYKNYFNVHGVSMQMTNKAVRKVAKLAFEQKVGVRGLKGIMEATLENAMFEVPRLQKTITGFVVESKNINNEHNITYITRAPSETQSRQKDTAAQDDSNSEGEATVADRVKKHPREDKRTGTKRRRDCSKSKRIKTYN